MDNQVDSLKLALGGLFLRVAHSKFHIMQFHFINIVSVTIEIVPENLQPEFYAISSGKSKPINTKKPWRGWEEQMYMKIIFLLKIKK